MDPWDSRMAWWRPAPQAPPRRPRFPGPRKVCPHCGLPSETTAKDCPVCGARFKPAWWRRVAGLLSSRGG